MSTFQRLLGLGRWARDGVFTRKRKTLQRRRVILLGIEVLESLDFPKKRGNMFKDYTACS